MMSGPGGELADRHLERGQGANGPPGDQDRDRVAGRRADHRQGADELAALLHADEEHDAEEADTDAEEPHPVDALRAVDPGREDDREDRRGGLDHGREPRVDPRVGEAEQPERQRVVERAERDERAAVAAQHPEAPAPVEEGKEDERADDGPTENDDRRLELVDAELDEEERGAPDRGEEEQEAEIATGHAATLDAVAAGPSHPPARLAS